METPLWEQLPAATRQDADTLIRAGSTLHAVAMIFRSGLIPGLSLPGCQDLVARRRDELGLTTSPRAPTLSELIKKVDADRGAAGEHPPRRRHTSLPRNRSTMA